MTVTPERLKRIMDLGLTEYQARVYLALLELGSSTASQIPAVSRVPRTRVYATMKQLHEKGLVEIIPETPLRYRPVPIKRFLEQRAKELRERAMRLEERVDSFSKEYAIRGELAMEERGRFEAIYGRRNVRERLMKMYQETQREIIGIGTSKSPSRIVKSAIYTLAEKVKQGVTVRYAFPVTPQNKEHIDILSNYAKIKAINVHLPIYFYVFDQREILFNHPIPDDDSFYRGDDIAIWTDDQGIARAMGTIAEKIWNSGTEPGTVDVTEPALEVARQFIQLLGHRGRPAFESMGVHVGRELARSFKSSSLPELMVEVTTFWKRNGLGLLGVVSKEPLVVEVENYVDCGKMLSIGRTVCSFVERVLTAILEAKIGPVEVKENRCYGAGSNRCRITFEIGS
jgi:sugar-specific transcriptional regulator TrmB/predicted hydrocarbon binding protein